MALSVSSATITGPSMVTSPAPMVITTSPGSAAAATRAATEESRGADGVEATLASLDALDELPVAEHVAVFERAHRQQQDALTGGD